MPIRSAYVLTQCWHTVPGGTAVAALAIADALEASGEVVITGIGAGGRRQPAPPFVPKQAVVRQRLPYQFLYDAWHRGWFPPERATGPVDVVHSTVPMTPPATAPLVMTLHDVFPVLEPTTLTKRGVRMMTTAFDRAKANASIVTCSSKQTLDDCVSIGFAPDRLRLVPLGVEDRVVSDDDRARVASYRRSDRPYFFYAGTVEPRKNLPFLIEAFAKANPEADLLLAGPDGWNESLPDLSSTPSIRRLGFVPSEDLPALMEGAVALLYPSRREGFGLPALESMVAETPVVGTIGTAIAEVVAETGRLLPHDDADAWVDTIRELASEPDSWATLGAPARERALTYTWDRTAAGMIDAYRDAIGGAS